MNLDSEVVLVVCVERGWKDYDRIREMIVTMQSMYQMPIISFGYLPKPAKAALYKLINGLNKDRTPGLESYIWIGNYPLPPPHMWSGTKEQEEHHRLRRMLLDERQRAVLLFHDHPEKDSYVRRLLKFVSQHQRGTNITLTEIHSYDELSSPPVGSEDDPRNEDR